MLSLWDILDHRQPWAFKFQRAEVRMKEAVFSRVLQIAYQSEIGPHKQKGSTPGPNPSIYNSIPWPGNQYFPLDADSGVSTRGRSGFTAAISTHSPTCPADPPPRCGVHGVGVNIPTHIDFLRVVNASILALHLFEGVEEREFVGIDDWPRQHLFFDVGQERVSRHVSRWGS